MKTIDFSYFIERYNAGEMNETEKIWFEKELQGNKLLREEVALRRKTDAVLQDLDTIRLRSKLMEIEKSRAEKQKVVKPWGNSLKYAAVLTAFILVGSLFLLNNRKLSSDELLEKYYEPYEAPAPLRSKKTFVNQDYITAVEYFNVHDYRKAALYFSKVVENDPRYMESTLLYGVSNFEEKNYPEAEHSFAKVIDDDNNLFIEDAQWYLALCYLKTGEQEKASRQFTSIKNSESIYSKKAKKILRNI